MNRISQKYRGCLLLVTFGLVSFVLPSRPAFSQDEAEVGPIVRARAELLQTQLEASKDSPLGLIPLLGQFELTRWVPSGFFDATASAIISDTATHPLVRAVGVYWLARSLRNSGNVEDSQSLLADEGFLSAWSMIGPFPNDGMAGFQHPYAPETSRDPDGRYEGKVGQVGWRDISDMTRLGYVDFGVLAAPSHDAVVYATTIVTVPEREEARLWISTDGAYKIWLNGELLGLVDTNLGSGPLREWYDLTLPRGDNELVLKVAGETGSLGAVVRVTDQDGNPIDELTSSVDFPYSETALSQETSAPPTGTVVGLFSDLLLDSAGTGLVETASHDALTGAAYVLYALQELDPSEPWRQFLNHRASCTEGTTPALLFCAQVQTQYWQRLQSLRLAVELGAETDAERLWATYQLTELLYRGVGDSVLDEVRQRIEDMLQEEPEFVPALILHAWLFLDQGQQWLAHDILNEAFERAPDSPAVVTAYQTSLYQVGDSGRALDVLRHQYEIDDGSNVESFVRALLMADARDEAVAILTNEIDVRPTSLSLYWTLADSLSNGGDDEGAENLYRRAVEIVPGSASAWEELGRFFVRTGQTESASEAFAEALAIEPQNQWLSDYQAVLQLEEERFYERYVLSLDDILSVRLPEQTVATRGYYPIVSQRIIRVFPNGVAAQYVQEAFQVNTRQGVEQLREYAIQFTPDIEAVDLLRVRIIKPDGSVLESFQRWEESLSQPWYGLYYDFRALVLGFEDLQPGDIVEVSYSIADLSSESIFDSTYGDFQFVQSHQPQGFVRYGLIHPTEMTFQTRFPELPHTAQTEQIGDDVHLIVELTNVPFYEEDASMPGLSEVADHIHVSTFADWGEVSSWYWNLVEDQLIASPEIESTVEDLIRGLSTVEERVAAIHEYVVRNTRYVGLEFGIHGYRPYRTTVCFTRRFGDCKDTASLMKVMLEIAGIDSYLTLVRTRDHGSIDLLPASLAVFNHVITYVPELDLFLDGTAGFSGVSELPSGDQGASAVIVMDGEGYRFLTIPVSEPEENMHVIQLTVDLAAETQPATGTMLATGQYAPALRRHYEAESDREDEFQRQLRDQFAGAELVELSMTGLDDITQPVQIDLVFEGATWWRASGDEMLIRPLGFESSLTQQFAPSAYRGQPLVLSFPFIERYEIVYQLPEGYRVIADTTEWEGASTFGRYSLNLQLGESELIVIGEFELSVSRVSATDYVYFREFIQNVEQVVNRNISIIGGQDG